MMLFLKSLDERGIGVALPYQQIQRRAFSSCRNRVNTVTVSKQSLVSMPASSCGSSEIHIPSVVAADRRSQDEVDPQKVGGVFTHNTQVSVRPGFFQ